MNQHRHISNGQFFYMLACTVVIFGCLGLWAGSARESDDCIVQVVVGRHTSTDTEITVPCVNKSQIADIAASFFGKGDVKVEREMRDHLNTAQNLTLTITSRRKP